MQLPKLTHLQFVILGLLRDRERCGRSLRDGLLAFDIRKRGPAFYQMMARLEDSGLVEGWYEQQIVESQIIRERHYRILGDGRTAWETSRDFYEAAIKGFEGRKSGLAYG